jgi:hypothetical protein
MTTYRHRMTVAALTLLAAGLSACANGPTSPLDSTSKQQVSAVVDTAKKVPTIPWFDVTNGSVPTLPWH